MSKINNPSRSNGSVSLVRPDKRESRESSTRTESYNRRAPSPARPLVSAADVGRDGYAEVLFSQSQKEMLKTEAKQRAPEGSLSYYRHFVGLTGEGGVGTLLGVPFDRRITEDYTGDDGYDLVVPREDCSDPLRIEVKTTQSKETQDLFEPECTISGKEIDQADYFVLCCTHAPGLAVNIVGYAERRLLKQTAKVHGRDEYLLAPEYLRPIGPIELYPDDFHAAMNGSRQRCHSSKGR